MNSVTVSETSGVIAACRQASTTYLTVLLPAYSPLSRLFRLLGIGLVMVFSVMRAHPGVAWVTGWGETNNNVLAVPTDLTNAIAVAAGGYFSLALRADGTVIGWGQNYNGQTTPPRDSQVLRLWRLVPHIV